MTILYKLGLLFCLIGVGCAKEQEERTFNISSESLIGKDVDEYFRVWINDDLQAPLYFKLRKANGASRMHLVADLPYFFQLSLFATPIFVGPQIIYSGNESDLSKKFKRTHFEFFQHENASIIRYYDIDSTQQLNNQLMIIAVDSLQRTVCAQFKVTLRKSYERVGNAPDSLSLRGEIKTRYYD
ncbi:MAG: hypothetical protein HC892_12380 [Saprospiraceae bacterium]|nr:hypothetical protein [Saprospiraceae bacterium]